MALQTFYSRSETLSAPLKFGIAQEPLRLAFSTLKHFDGMSGRTDLGEKIGASDILRIRNEE